MNNADPTSVRGLPSDRRYPGDTRQVEFLAQPDQQRIDGAVKMLSDLARTADGMGAQDGEILKVCLTLVRLPIGLPFNLFSFHLASIDSDGEVIDEVSSEHEIQYAFVVNQPVALLREAAVRFLLDLVSRQAPIQQVMQERRSVDDLPRLIAATDASTAELAWDMPSETAQTLSVVRERAADVRLRLQVRFQLDPFPDQLALGRRVWALRTLYDSEERVRDAINRTVSAIGGRHPSLRGGREDIRGFLRRQTTLQGMRQYMNQTVRDAEVCGNGYLHTEMTGLDAQMRCLRPEDTLVLRGGGFRHVTSTGVEVFDADRVLHLRGLEQIDSPYGISILEPLLYVLARRRNVAEVRAALKVMPPGAPEAVQMKMRQLVAVVAAVERQTDEQVERLLEFFPRGLAAASEDLYFPGQERYG
jgi:hypothetical protein